MVAGVRRSDSLKILSQLIFSAVSTPIISINVPRYYDQNGKPVLSNKSNTAAKSSSSTAGAAKGTLPSDLPDPKTANEAVENLKSHLKDANLSEQDMGMLKSMLGESGKSEDDMLKNLMNMGGSEMQSFQNLLKNSVPPPEVGMPIPEDLPDGSNTSTKSSSSSIFSILSSSPILISGVSL